MRHPRDAALDIIVSAAFVVLALLWTFPLARHLTTHIPGGSAGDNLAALWGFWWMRFAVMHLADPFATGHLFAPIGTSLALHTNIALPAFAGATLLRPLPLIAAHNTLLIATFVLNAMSSYWLIRRVTPDRLPAIVGAVVFAGSPFMDGHLQGQFSLLSAWTLPLVCLATIETARGSRRWAFALGLLVGGTVYLDYYYTVFAVALVAILLPLQSRVLTFARDASTGPRRIHRLVVALVVVDLLAITFIVTTGGFDRRIAGFRIRGDDTFNLLEALWVLLAAWVWLTWRPRFVLRRSAPASWTWAALMSSAAVAAVVAAPLLLRILDLAWNGDYVSQVHYWRSGSQGIDLVTLVSGNPFSWWSGAWARRVAEHFALDTTERVGWLGVVPMALACAAWRGDPSPHVQRWTVVGAAAFVWALGPHLSVFGHNTGMILPNAVLRYVPILSNARIPSRAMVVVYLALGVLSALGLSRLRQRGLGLTASLVLLIFLIAEFVPAPYPLLALDRPALYEVLRTEPGAGSVLELPLGLRDGLSQAGALDPLVLWYQTIHERPLVGRYISRLAPSVLRAYETDPLLAHLIRLSSNTPSSALDAPDRESALRSIRAHGIRFVVLNRRTAAAPLVYYVEQLRLTPLSNDGDRTLFRCD